MSSKNFVLAYSNENYSIAKQFEDDLGKAGIRFDHLSCETWKNGKLSREILKSKKTVFLLISDNYLKSTNCMNDALQMLNTCLAQNRVQPIIIDGEFYNKNTSSFQRFPTEFARISDLIKYMNHWQEHYLKMRKNKVNVSEKQEVTYNKELKRVRTISAEIGEFLRILRETEYWNLDDLIESHYEWFFNRIGKQDLLIKYKKAFSKGDLALKNQSIVGDNTKIESDATIPTSPAPVDEENTPTQIELEKKKQKTYDIIADIFDDDSEDGNDEENLTDDHAKIDINNINEITTWSEIITDKDPMAFDDKKDFFNKIAHLVEKDEDHLAVKQLDLFLSQHPESGDAYMWLARISTNDEDFNLAKSHYEKSIELDATNVNALTEYGSLVFHHFKNQPKLASKAFKKAIALDSNNVNANYFYALLLTEVLEKPKKAIKYFKKTLELAPTHAFANYDLAFLYFNQKDKLNAAKHYEYAFTINPELRVPENDKAFWYNDYLEQGKSHLEQDSNKPKKSKKKKKKQLVKDFTKPELELTDNPEDDMEDEVEKPRRKTVLITGATSGIGKATADIFAKNGYRIIITGRRADRLQELKDHYIAKHNSDIHTLTFDVRDWDESQKNIETLPEEWQEVDLLINNAGLAKGYAPVHEGDLSHWETMIDTNIKGLLYMTRLITPGMVKRQQGQIINVCSSAGHEVYPNGNVYCATKHAVDALTKGLRLELHKHGIRVSQVSPGHVEETEFAAVRFDGDLERASIYEDFQPLKSSDVADAIYYMASCPPHVTIQDMIMMGTQQASSNFIDRSGRK